MEGEGGLRKVITTIENFLDIHDIAIKSGDFSQNLLQNKNSGKILSQGKNTCCHGNAVFNAMFRQVLLL